MDKEKILYGIIGLLAGMIIGYIGTNYLNRTYMPTQTAESGEPGNLPAGHPPAGGSSSNSSAGPQAEIMAVIQKATDEPSNFAAQMEAANLYRQINRHEKEIEFYERAARIKPNDLNVLILLGDTNFNLQRYEDAENWYQRAIKLDPKNATVRMDLGLTYFLRQPRNLDRAIAEYRQALKLDPRHEKSLQNLTVALIEKGDAGAARDSFKLLEQISPNNNSLPELRSRLKD
ncbi:MAG: tetratricopeptide repeat protein [Acidobacteria bacterium]|nr:tetratricopeptide repeat protein [Acidobacteriota bacterium]